ncbi:MAG: hypothetical protein IH587_12460 [Anaerolineae bacterium]|nr:hypothetical protein [Anaerolineae bacterium]
MIRSGTRTYVGFGFGAIQAGLFLYEASRTDAFGRLVVAEVMPDIVEAVRSANGYFAVNIAHAERIEQVTVGPVAVENPAEETDRARLIDAIAEAEEIGTAIPSVSYYASDAPGSLHRVLAQGLRRKIKTGGPRAIVYAAENHNRAAEILEEHVMSEIPAAEHAAVHDRVRFLNTVIGKMSGVVADPDELQTQKLKPAFPGSARAFLVEAFNRILISQIHFDAPFERGIAVFEEKADLLPFEEAKLYGHNATHALAAYLGNLCGVSFISELREIPGALAFLREAFLEESGAALIKKYTHSDPLFTDAGYTAYADDLLTRMMNPYLRDSTERVGRDPTRKLGWNDRLIGTMRLARAQNIVPRRFALGAAAALAMLDQQNIEARIPIEPALTAIWHDANPDRAEAAIMLKLIEGARNHLRSAMSGESSQLFVRLMRN